MLYIWLARFGSFFAEHMSESVIAILVWMLTDNVFIAAFTISSSRIALWVFGLIAGHSADNKNKKKILILTTSITCLAFWAIVILNNYDFLTASLLALLNFIAMSAKTFEYTAINTLISTIRTTPEFKKNNVIVDSSKRWARMLSPLIFVAFIQDIGTFGLLLLVAIIYTFVVFFYYKANYPSSAQAPNLQRNLGFSLRETRKFLTPSIWGVYILFALYNISYFSALWIILPHHFSTSGQESYFGLALIAFSFGGLIGNILYKTFLDNRSSMGNLIFSIALVGIGCFSLSFSINIAFICLAVCIAGIGTPIMDMAMLHHIRENIEPAKHGMAFSMFRFFADLGLIMGGLTGGVLLIILERSEAYVLTGAWIFFLLLITGITRFYHNKSLRGAA